MSKDKIKEPETSDGENEDAKEDSPTNGELLERIRLLEEENSRLTGAGEAQKQVREFFESFPGAEEFCDDLCEYIENSEDAVDTDGLEKALITVMLKKHRSPEALSGDEEFLNSHIFNNQRIRDRIINEYIDSVKDAPSVCLRRSGLIKTQAEKPKTVSAAGELARALFRK